MDFTDYQTAAFRTGSGSTGSLNERLSLGGLGVAGEAGEVADLLKKVVHHKHELDTDLLKKELGDVLWYVSYLCSSTGITLEDVAKANIAKLQKRYPEGFSTEASKARVDVDPG